MRVCLWLSLACVACAGPGEDPSTGDAPSTEVYVIRTITIGRVEDGVSDGFDLDHVSTALGDPTGCGQTDWVDPSGQTGIDNAMGSIMPLLDGTEAAVAGTLLQGAVDSGELLLLLEVSHDTRGPAFRMLRGNSEALLGTNGLLLPYQTFDLDPEVSGGDPVAASSDADGNMVATDFAFQLPLEILRAQLSFAFNSTAIRVGPDEGGVRSGVVGGGAPWEPIVAELDTTPIDDSVKAILSTVVAQKADLDPDEQGVCRSMSAVFTFDAVPAFVYPDAEGG